MKSRSITSFDLIFGLSVFVSLFFWIFYSLFLEPVTFIVYFVIWIAGFGILFYIKRAKLITFFRQINLPTWIKLLCLLYGIILLEEVFAAFSNHLLEPFSFPTLMLRILQFQFFNIIAFTGFIVGWVILSHRLTYTPREVFYLSGLWGIWSENLWKSLFSEPVAFLLMVPLIVATYGIIAYPIIALKTHPQLDLDDHRIKLTRWIKIPLTIGIQFLLSLPFVFIIQWIFANVPNLFPPGHFLGH